jgi:hypothetical protein
MQEVRSSNLLSSTVFRAYVREKVTNASHLEQAVLKAARLMSVQEAVLADVYHLEIRRPDVPAQ